MELPNEGRVGVRLHQGQCETKVPYSVISFQIQGTETVESHRLQNCISINSEQGTTTKGILEAKGIGCKALPRMDLGPWWVKRSAYLESQGACWQPRSWAVSIQSQLGNEVQAQAGGSWNCSCCPSPGAQISVPVSPPHLITTVSAFTSSWAPGKCLASHWDRKGWSASFLPDPLPNCDFAYVPSCQKWSSVKTGRLCRTRILLPSWLPNPRCQRFRGEDPNKKKGHNLQEFWAASCSSYLPLLPLHSRNWASDTPVFPFPCKRKYIIIIVI